MPSSVFATLISIITSFLASLTALLASIAPINPPTPVDNSAKYEGVLRLAELPFSPADFGELDEGERYTDISNPDILNNSLWLVYWDGTDREAAAASLGVAVEDIGRYMYEFTTDGYKGPLCFSDLREDVSLSFPVTSMNYPAPRTFTVYNSARCQGEIGSFAFSGGQYKARPGEVGWPEGYDVVTPPTVTKLVGQDPTVRGVADQLTQWCVATWCQT